MNHQSKARVSMEKRNLKETLDKPLNPTKYIRGCDFRMGLQDKTKSPIDRSLPITPCKVGAN
ncbi:hypothetical protein GT2_32_00050 [Parageobacillus thermoglucosidasius NBRC 107763]|nr:hypothetical protein GT2_32_00050 [Parageobacillus thermoglucosidasius NBRC 107763]